ncbi:hypothetical protein [Paraburkholderia caledonica]|uniref:Uncharacterized protein n=1 Tax=Paraburkholderia caledonica TaxID=134536 RepID=A0AB73I3H7_9BURK|nr:hypothetical protein [Paraburkholderia caledonica]
MTDQEMADAVCCSIDMHGHDRCTEQSEWDELKAEQDWVYALLAERDALRIRVVELEDRVARSAKLIEKAVGKLGGDAQHKAG